MTASNTTVDDENPVVQYTATSGQTIFDAPWLFFEDSDLTVYLTPTGNDADDTADLLTLTTDYTVTNTDTETGGTIVLNSGATTSDTITIYRIMTLERQTDYQSSGDLLAETLNREQDTEMMSLQQLRSDFERSVSLRRSENTNVDPTLPTPTASKVIGWDNAGTALTNYNLNDGTDDSGNTNYTPPGTGAQNRNVEDKLQETVSVIDYGAAGDGTTDDTAAIQAAIDYIGTIGGAVYFPAGIYLITSTLTISLNNTYLLGDGSGWRSDTANLEDEAATVILWDSTTSGDVMVHFTSIASGEILKRGGIRRININGDSVATKGLLITSCVGLDITEDTINDCATVGLELNTIAGTLASVKDTQHCNISDLLIDQKGVASGAGILLDNQADGLGNPSFNIFNNVHITYDDGNGITLGASDSNIFNQTTMFRQSGGTGLGVEFLGNTVLAQDYSRSNVFNLLDAGAGGVTAKNNTQPSENNVIFTYSRENGAPAPTIESGASLFVVDNRGIFGHGWGSMPKVFGDDLANIVSEQANLTTETLRVRNNSENHFRIVDASGNEWGVAIKSGGLEVTRIAGTGSMTFAGNASMLHGTRHISSSSGTTGGAGSSGSGNQYIELNINGTTYKVLHDGTV